MSNQGWMPCFLLMWRPYTDPTLGCGLQESFGGQMQREANQHESLINTEEFNVGWSGKQARQRPSDPSSRPWTDSEIRVFLQEWEVVEQEVGHPGKKIHKKTKALCQRLYQRGLKKSWGSCFHLLLSLQDLHRTLCNERWKMEPLFSPYAEDLYRILGSDLQESLVQGPVYEGPGHPLLMYPQAPRYQPGDHGAPVPPVELRWNPVPMMPQGISCFPAGSPGTPAIQCQLHTYTPPLS